MGQLRGLAGVKGALACQYVANVDEAVARIRTRRAVTAAGPSGALNVWRDDSKRLRSSFCRYLSVVAEAQHEDIDCLRAWLRVWWPKMGRDEA